METEEYDEDWRAVAYKHALERKKLAAALAEAVDFVTVVRNELGYEASADEALMSIVDLRTKINEGKATIAASAARSEALEKILAEVETIIINDADGMDELLYERLTDAINSHHAALDAALTPEDRG